MLKKVTNLFKKNPVISVGVLFVLFSIIINTITILTMEMSYSRDIIHVFPTIFYYEEVLHERVGGLLTTEFYLLPIILVIDFLVGIIIGFIINKITKKEKTYFIALGISFILYWFVICFQWIPVI